MIEEFLALGPERQVAAVAFVVLAVLGALANVLPPGFEDS